MRGKLIPVEMTTTKHKKYVFNKKTQDISNISFKVFVVRFKTVHHIMKIHCKMGSIWTLKEIFVFAFVVFMKERMFLLLLYISLSLYIIYVGSSIMSIPHTLN